MLNASIYFDIEDIWCENHVWSAFHSLVIWLELHHLLFHWFITHLFIRFEHLGVYKLFKNSEGRKGEVFANAQIQSPFLAQPKNVKKLHIDLNMMAFNMLIICWLNDECSVYLTEWKFSARFTHYNYICDVYA